MFKFNGKFIMFGTTPVDNQFLLEYMPTATGEQLRVYLYGLMACYHPQEGMSIEQMSHDLDLSREEILRAYRHWERMGLVERTGDNPLSFCYVHVNQAVFTGESQNNDWAYERFTDAVYAVFGNDYHIHGQTLVRYYEWVEELGLPQEVVLMLIRHMISIRGKSFSFASAERLAVELSEQHVKTIEDAEVALSRNRRNLEGSRHVIRRFNLRREPTEEEIKLYGKWTDEWGFSDAAILEACKDTTASMTPSFKYLDGILRNQIRHGSASAGDAQAVAQERAEKEKKADLLKEIIRTLGGRQAVVNDGTLAVLDSMLALYPQEVLLLAAQECSVQRDPHLEDVMRMLESWKKKGMEGPDEIRQYVQQFHQERNVLATLREILGREIRYGEAQRRVVHRWQTQYGMSEEMIFHCAEFAREADKPLGYLDQILKDCFEKGIRDTASADMNRKDWLARFGGKSGGGGEKRVQDQKYEQRENTEQTGEDFPEWLRSRREEMMNGAQGDTGNPSE